ncbi:MAG: hypothetical protein ACOYL6_19115 [Bacteriovoracaceae bacterium]
MKSLLGFLSLLLIQFPGGNVKAADSTFISPRETFSKLSKRKKQMWVVGYMNSTLEDSIKDLEVSFENGADAIVFEGGDYNKMDANLGEIRKRFPDKVIGVDFLGPDSNLYTYKETFALAKKHHLQIAWTDFSGVDLIKEAPEVSLHSIMSEKPKDVFYVSGIHMKYSTLIDENKTIELSALQAMGWVDGIVITGLKTGVVTDPEKARRARSVIGNYPLGSASGTAVDNVQTLTPYVDFFLVNTSISDKNHRIIGEKVKALRKAMDVVVKVKGSKN